MFLTYLKDKDFVGSDMARKFLQMGYTRSRRYANHKGGKKYTSKADDSNKNKIYPYSSGSSHKQNVILPNNKDRFDNEKAQSAEIFKENWLLAKYNEDYIKQKADFQKRYGK